MILFKEAPHLKLTLPLASPPSQILYFFDIPKITLLDLRQLRHAEKMMWRTVEAFCLSGTLVLLSIAHMSLE